MEWIKGINSDPVSLVTSQPQVLGWSRADSLVFILSKEATFLNQLIVCSLALLPVCFLKKKKKNPVFVSSDTSTICCFLDNLFELGVNQWVNHCPVVQKNSRASRIAWQLTHAESVFLRWNTHTTHIHTVVVLISTMLVVLIRIYGS